MPYFVFLKLVKQQYFSNYIVVVRSILENFSLMFCLQIHAPEKIGPTTAEPLSYK